MNNFFYRDSDYDLFKKALRSTKNEPVVINILSNDSSLVDESKSTVSEASQRKQMSSKFQASPFDKFFGPRKKRTDPLDMKDFSSWKNKNYRESEKQIDETPEEATKFSFADYLNNKAKREKYNDEDQLKSANQKSIEQLASGDADYKKFSLDSYLNKLEQETKAKKDFEESEDLFDNQEDLNASLNTEQDENFMASTDVDVEDIAFGGVSGERFAFDREELDSVKARLEKMEREANNIKDKPTTKVISSDDIDEITGKDDDDDGFDLGKLGIEDDIERVNEKINSLNKALQITGDDETETPKVEHKRFVEVNKNFDDAEEVGVEEDISESVDELIESNDEEVGVDQFAGEEFVSEASEEQGVVEPVMIAGSVATDEDIAEDDEETSEESFVDALEIPKEESDDEIVDTSEGGEFVGGSQSTINKTDDYLTKADFKDFTEEMVNKFSEMYRGAPVSPDATNVDVNTYQPAGYVDTTQMYTQTTVGPDQPAAHHQIYQQNSELQAKIVELLEQNKKSDQEVAERLKLAEIEKQRVADKYEARLRELEASMKQQEEDAKQQVYIERLKNDIKFKKSESKYKLREEQIRESEKLSSENQLASEKLKSELKNYLNVSNLEMDKKLLECVNKLHKETIIARQESEENEVEEVEEIDEVEVKKPARTRARASRPASRRRTSTVKSRMRTRTPRRKMDSDIIGGINFD